jgi:hypothetical protein
MRFFHIGERGNRSKGKEEKQQKKKISCPFHLTCPLMLKVWFVPINLSKSTGDYWSDIFHIKL